MTNVMDSLLDANVLMQLKANTIVKGRISEIRSGEEDEAKKYQEDFYDYCYYR